MNVLLHVTAAMIWWSFSVTGFCALWVNVINIAMEMFLKGAFNLYMLLCGNNVLKQKTCHSAMAYYVHVILDNTAKHFYVLAIRSFSN